ncbi:hypothetical protein GF323_03080 [Candidatus Woesearchaeota archaeon]|nr:hypothetical protein [Candidatus Woesearchaeota archaeon]
MKKNRLYGIILVLISLLFLAGFTIQNSLYWEIMHAAAVMGGLYIGISLLKEKCDSLKQQ